MKKLALVTLLFVGSCFADDQSGSDAETSSQQIEQNDEKQWKSTVKDYLSDPKFVICLVATGLIMVGIYLQLVVIKQAQIIGQIQIDHACALHKLQQDYVGEMAKAQRDHVYELKNAQLNSEMSKLNNEMIRILSKM